MVKFIGYAVATLVCVWVFCYAMSSSPFVSRAQWHTATIAFAALVSFPGAAFFGWLAYLALKGQRK